MKRTEAALPRYGASHLSEAKILLRIELLLSDHQCAHPHRRRAAWSVINGWPSA
jgi:hypothetical protein